MDNNEIQCYFTHANIIIPFDMVVFYEKDQNDQSSWCVQMLNQMYVTLHENAAKDFCDLYLKWLESKNVRKLRPISDLTIKYNCIK